MNVLDEMKMMVAQLNRWTALYDEGHPEVSDKEWDDHYFRLLEFENRSGVRLSNSPTQCVSYEVVNQLNKVQHNHPMLSLAKTKEWSEFLSYFHNKDTSKDVIGTVKLDGLTCSLRYIDGKLVSAETRGNGEVGEDILHNALVVKNIPNRINYMDELIVDGEIICTYKDFEPFKDEYANPRNFAAGSIRLLDSKECADRNLTFVVWNIVKGFPESNSFMDNLIRIEKLGFTITPWTSSFDWDAKDFLVDQAKKLGYPIDGLVGRFDDITFGTSLGATGHHANAAYAFKFYDEEYDTELLDIEWTMGRTGILTPVAIFEPVDTGDSIVERASLHNVSICNEILHIPYKGQKIKIAKMNMIIPQIVSAEWEDQDDYIQVPEVCPICGKSAELVESDSGTINLVCSNPQCDGKLINKLDHFCGKKGLDIRGLSVATLEKLIDWGWVGNITEIYSLSNFRKDWIQKPGFGPKSVDNILDAIEKSKNCELHSFISALGIPLIGSTYAKEICKLEWDWHNIREDIEGRYDFSKWDGFGPEMRDALLKFDYSEADYLANNVLTLTNNIWINADEVINQTLEGVTVVITGKLSIYKNRATLQADIEAKGGKVSSSVSKNTNYLINNDTTSNSSKNLSAQKLGIEIINEENFIKKFLT